MFYYLGIKDNFVTFLGNKDLSPRKVFNVREKNTWLSKKKTLIIYYYRET